MTAKERIQQWIQRQSREFTEQWCSSVESNPALDVVKRLSESAEELEYQSASCLPALSVSGRKGRGEGGGGGVQKGDEEECGRGEEGLVRVLIDVCLFAYSPQAICTILMDPTSNVSAFELMHCNLHVKLMR